MKHSKARDIGRVRVVAFAGILILVCSLFAHFAIGLWPMVSNHGDNQAYLRIAAAIDTMYFKDLPSKYFWGLPYVVVALSTLTGIAATPVLYLICVVGFLSSSWLAAELWGEWTAIAF